MIRLFPRVLRTFSFRALATTFIILLLVLLSNFLVTVYKANLFLGQGLGPEWSGFLKQIEAAYFYGLVSIGFLTFIVIAAILDLINFMKMNRRFREASRTIIAFANGELHLRIQDTVEGPMGELQRSFNSMADQVVENLNQLEESNQLRKELVASVAHDLGGPVTAILGFIDTIILKLDSIKKEDIEEYLSIAKSNTLFLSKLVGELSDLSRFDMDSIPFAKQPFDLNLLVESITKRYQSSSPGNIPSIDLNLPKEKITALGDVMMIERVICNLLENAIHYTNPKGRITIDCEAKLGEVQIKVSDTGSGIPREDLPYVFERFYRVDKDRSRTTGGSGLGLAIVKKILDLHESSIDLVSEVGRGTEIIFTLPLEPEI